MATICASDAYCQLSSTIYRYKDTVGKIEITDTYDPNIYGTDISPYDFLVLNMQITNMSGDHVRGSTNNQEYKFEEIISRIPNFKESKVKF